MQNLTGTNTAIHSTLWWRGERREREGGEREGGRERDTRVCVAHGLGSFFLSPFLNKHCAHMSVDNCIELGTTSSAFCKTPPRRSPPPPIHDGPPPIRLRRLILPGGTIFICKASTVIDDRRVNTGVLGYMIFHIC